MQPVQRWELKLKTILNDKRASSRTSDNEKRNCVRRFVELVQ